MGFKKRYQLKILLSMLAIFLVFVIAFPPTDLQNLLFDFLALILLSIIAYRKLK